MYGGFASHIPGLLRSWNLTRIALVTVLLLPKNLGAQMNNPATSCFRVDNSAQCPYLNGLMIAPIDGMYSSEEELEAFLDSQGPRDKDYKQTFASENDCVIDAANTHRYHKSVICYTASLIVVVFCLLVFPLITAI